MVEQVVFDFHKAFEEQFKKEFGEKYHALEKENDKLKERVSYLEKVLANLPLTCQICEKLAK